MKISYLIMLHALLGTVALLSGAVALIVKKGSRPHKLGGKVFFYSMLFSAILACIISWIPGHENTFLFAIGIFSVYLLLNGYRSLRFRQKHVNLSIDFLIAYVITITGFAMITTPVIMLGKLNAVLLVFGLASVYFGLRDLYLYKHRDSLKKHSITTHIGKMTGGYIAALSAFLVVNNVFPWMWNWFGPTIPGVVFIGYHIRRVKGKG